MNIFDVIGSRVQLNKRLYMMMMMMMLDNKVNRTNQEREPCCYARWVKFWRFLKVLADILASRASNWVWNGLIFGKSATFIHFDAHKNCQLHQITLYHLSNDHFITLNDNHHFDDDSDPTGLCMWLSICTIDALWPNSSPFIDQTLHISIHLTQLTTQPTLHCNDGLIICKTVLFHFCACEPLRKHIRANMLKS